MRLFEKRLMVALCWGASLLAGCGGRGGGIIVSPTAPSTPIPVTAKAKFAYTGNEWGSLSGYSVDTATGALSALNGFPIAIGGNPTVVAVDPQNRFFFVGDIAFGRLHVFSINSTSGALSEIGTSPYATVSEPVAVAVDPGGTHLYVADQSSNAVGGFSLGTAGALTPIAGLPIATPGMHDTGDDVVINAAGTFLYVQTSTSIYCYRISANTGSLALIQTIAGPSIGGGLALDPHGNYIYAVGSGINSIQAYSMNGSTGMLTSASASPMVEHNGAYTLSVSPTGQFAYTIENNNDLVSYSLDSGVFKAVGSVYAQVYGEKIGIDPSGSYVYVPQACSNCPSGVYNVVNEFSIGSTGALTKIPGSPVAAGTTPWGIAFTTQ